MTVPGEELLFLALGGSGEIGMNANFYGCRGQWIMVDCGISFADPAYPGVDVVMPDLTWIEDRADRLAGIVLTHGHEDHIGALPYLARDLGAPLYATPFTAGLIRHKLTEAGIADAVELNVVPEGGNIRLGAFDLRYVPLAHSIAEGNGLLIETPFGRVFHTGDWKLDRDPLIGAPATPEQLTALGDAGILALVCDSTNVFNADASGSEGDVRDGLRTVVTSLSGRVLVTTFASNAARLDTLGQVARETGRQLCVAGRSLDRMLEIGRATGYFADMPPPVDFETAMRLPRNQVLIVATGGQGEPRAALARIADGSHPLVLEAGDTVLFSSRQIPGNELAIARIQNQLAARDIVMITDRQAHIHVSGHPGRPDLAAMYRWMRPRVVLPVHGEMRHMMEQARFAQGQGVPQTVVQRNGDLIRLAPGAPGRIEQVTAGRLVLDGDVILAADGVTMNERRRLAQHGQMSVAIAFDRAGKPLGTPQIRMQGVPVEDERDDLLDAAEEAATHAIADHQRGRDPGNIEMLREAVRLAVRRVATRWTGKKPVVDVLIIEG